MSPTIKLWPLSSLVIIIALILSASSLAQIKLFHSDSTDQSVSMGSIIDGDYLTSSGRSGSDIFADSSNGLNVPDAIEVYTMGNYVYRR